MDKKLWGRESKTLYKSGIVGYPIYFANLVGGLKLKKKRRWADFLMEDPLQGLITPHLTVLTVSSVTEVVNGGDIFQSLVFAW